MPPERQPKPQRFTPAAGFHWLTPLYDMLVATLTRERIWRSALVSQIAPTREDVILDLGCGTGSTLICLAQIAPGACLIGHDPDPEMLRRAHHKTASAGATLHLAEGFIHDAIRMVGERRITKIVSSLVLHQVPLAEKQALLASAYNLLPSGGTLHIADYGLQATVAMRLLFRMTVQAIDGVADTGPQAEGLLPRLIAEAGFADIVETHAFNTMTGTIRLYRALRQ